MKIKNNKSDQIKNQNSNNKLLNKNQKKLRKNLHNFVLL